jgi:hypothetical protein
MGRFLASQGLHNQVIDGSIVVSIESSEYLNERLMLHCSSTSVAFGLLLFTLLLICLSMILRSQRDTTVIVSCSYMTCTSFYVEVFVTE